MISLFFIRTEKLLDNNYEKVEINSNKENVWDEVFILNEIVNETIGWIEFPNKQRNNITLGTSDDILNMDIVGLHFLSENLDKENNEIILAAHNKKGLFNILTKLKINDIVNLESLKDTYQFQVIKVDKYNKEEMLEFNSLLEGKTLKLITCVDNNQKRLVLTLKENII